MHNIKTKKYKLNKKALIHLSAYFAITLIFTFCSSEEEDCPDVNIPTLTLSFEQSEQMAFDTTFIYCSGLTDTIYTGNTNPPNLSIPLKLATDTTVLTFQLREADTLNLLTDNILFIHTNKLYAENIECGFQTLFYLHNVLLSSNFIDSVYILDTVINSDKSIHAKVFY